MTISRRKFISYTSAGLAATSLTSLTNPLVAADAPAKSQIKAIAFDGFVIFDPNSVAPIAEEVFPGNGAALTNEWRTRQFDYAWLRVVARHYANFWQVSQDALTYATNKLKLELTPEKRARLMNAYLELKTWPDSIASLAALKKAGLKLAFLSNFTPDMLSANVKHSSLEGIFEHAISTDQARTYKPDPNAYQLGIDTFKLKREEILFAAFGGWDAAGAKLFGYPTYWVNRQKLPVEELGATPNSFGVDMTKLVQFLRYESWLTDTL
jgi:2-haloacid dehalogenase